MSYLDHNKPKDGARNRMAQVVMGIDEPSAFDDMIGQRIKNKLIQYAYEKGYEGSHEQLLESILMLNNVIQITRQSIVDIMQAEVEMLAARDESKLPAHLTFMAGILHGQDMVEHGQTMMGSIDLE
jgi:hypothetical protein